MINKNENTKVLTSQNSPVLKECEDALNSYMTKVKNQKCTNCKNGIIVAKKGERFSCKYREEVDDWCEHWKQKQINIIDNVKLESISLTKNGFECKFKNKDKL